MSITPTSTHPSPVVRPQAMVHSKPIPSFPVIPHRFFPTQNLMSPVFPLKMLIEYSPMPQLPNFPVDGFKVVASHGV